MASFWYKSSTTLHCAIEIIFMVVLIMYQVFQVTLWLEVGKVTFVASSWCKSSTIFLFTVEISFIVALILCQVLLVFLWLRSFVARVKQITFVASFSVSWDKFSSTCKFVQIVQWLILFETYLMVVLILAMAKVKLVCTYDFHKKQNIFTLYVALFP